jgi:8-oxo-dGTP diphosphatase
MERIDTGQALVVKPGDGQILLVQNPSGYWGFPGARRDDGETLEQAAIRGAFEQTGLSIQVDRVAAIGEFLQALSAVHRLFVLFQAHQIAGNVQPQKLGEVADVEWFEAEKADWLVPWYPGGVGRLLESREAVYYAHEAFE